jgi:uncharacterized SAM-binding protein YcdF (DUF218 family)
VTVGSERPADPGAARVAPGPRRALLVGVAVLAVVAAAVPTVLVFGPRDDAVGATDAVVVLGGAGKERVDRGIDLVSQLRVPLVLSSSAMYFGWHRGYRCNVNAICLVPVPETTAEEAQAVASLVASEGWDHVTVVTSSHHTARARLLFRQCLGDAISVVGVPRPDGVNLQSRLREVVGMVAGATLRRAC